jgi:putative phage-type endonuclease
VIAADDVEDVIALAQVGAADALAYVDRNLGWNERRRTGIGGSEVAAVLGLNPHSRPIDVWARKVGIASDFAGNDATRWGQVLEPLIADEYQRRRGGAAHCHLDGPFDVGRHPTRPWQLYSIDRLVLHAPREPLVITEREYAADPARALAGRVTVRADDGRTVMFIDSGRATLPSPELVVRVLEIKSHGWQRRVEYGDEGSDDVPYPVLCQAAWYVSAIDCAGGADIAALFNTNRYEEFTVQRDPELESYLLEEVDRWWRAHVVARVEPPPDGSESFMRYVRGRFEKTTGQYVEPSPDVAAAVARLRVVEAVHRRVEHAREVARQAVALAIGEADGLQLDEGRLSFHSQQGRIDDAAVARELAERLQIGERQLQAIREKHRRPPTRVLRVPRAWSKDEIDLEHTRGLLAEGAPAAIDTNSEEH